jgi:hypothetical protein
MSCHLVSVRVYLYAPSSHAGRPPVARHPSDIWLNRDHREINQSSFPCSNGGNKGLRGKCTDWLTGRSTARPIETFKCGLEESRTFAATLFLHYVCIMDTALVQCSGRWPLFPPPPGEEKSRNQGIEWERLDPGAGDHPPSSSSCSTTANANHPRASTANSTVLARQARDETAHAQYLGT